MIRLRGKRKTYNYNSFTIFSTISKRKPQTNSNSFGILRYYKITLLNILCIKLITLKIAKKFNRTPIVTHNQTETRLPSKNAAKKLKGKPTKPTPAKVDLNG